MLGRLLECVRRKAVGSEGLLERLLREEQRGQVVIEGAISREGHDQRRSAGEEAEERRAQRRRLVGEIEELLAGIRTTTVLVPGVGTGSGEETVSSSRAEQDAPRETVPIEELTDALWTAIKHAAMADEERPPESAWEQNKLRFVRSQIEDVVDEADRKDAAAAGLLS